MHTTRGLQVLLHTCPLQVALMQYGVLKRDGRLQHKAFDEVLLERRELTTHCRLHHQLGQGIPVPRAQRRTRTPHMGSGRYHAIGGHRLTRTRREKDRTIQLQLTHKNARGVRQKLLKGGRGVHLPRRLQ